MEQNGTHNLPGHENEKLWQKMDGVLSFFTFCLGSLVPLERYALNVRSEVNVVNTPGLVHF